MNTIIKILFSIICLSVIIILHELGHMIAAKLCGITVKEFCIGFGPTIYEKQMRETSFKIKLLPILGYVNISGMTEEDESDPRGYNKKPIIKRIFTISAGAIANFITAILIFTTLFTFNGNFNKSAGNVLSLVSEGTPAAVAELKVNDKIIKVNDINVASADDINAITKNYADKPVKITIDRNGTIIEKNITLSHRIVDGKTAGLLGVTFAPQKEPLFTAFIDSFKETGTIIKDSFTTLPAAIMKDGIKAFSGPIGIAKITSNALTDGVWFFVYVMGLIAVSIGYFQLIPFPGLDGGWLLFLIYEAITRKKPSTKVVNVVQSTGIMVLLLFIAVITIKDIFFGV